MRKKRKEVMASVPARKRELRLVSVRRVQLQKSTGRVLAPNKLARSAPKRVAVRVNGGLVGEARGEMTRKRPLPSDLSDEEIAGVSAFTAPLVGTW
jgi:hypothetical protein